MSLAVAGADRFLQGLTGQAVAAAAAAGIKTKLYTTADPGDGAELAGHGYSDVTVGVGTFTRATQSNYRRLRFPAMEWFSDAASQAQTAESIAFQHGATLIWSVAQQLDPQNARVYAEANDIWLGIQLNAASFMITEAGADRGLQALAGEAVAAVDMFWELHSGAGVPTSANRLTGGGLDGIADGAWALSTVSGYRRAAQPALTFSAGLTADTNAEPTRLGLWRGRPEAGGVLHAWRPIAPANLTEDGASITIAANALYIEIELAGS